MTSARLPSKASWASGRRRGGEWGTRAASGSPPAVERVAARASALDELGVGLANPVPNTPLLLDALEVARLLGVGRTKVYELIARHAIPVVRVDRCVRVPADDLARWVAVHTTPPTDE